MLEKVQALSAEYEFEAVVPLSALTGDGVDILLAELSQLAEEGPHFFDDDDFTDQPERVIAGEIIREKILNNMREEIPHGTAVSVESMKEREDKDIIDIDAVIYCERDSHKGMLIGKQGSMLKTIGSQAREEIEAFLDAKVNLKLWVKVKEDWRNKEGLIKQVRLHRRITSQKSYKYLQFPAPSLGRGTRQELPVIFYHQRQTILLKRNVRGERDESGYRMAAF